MGRERRGPRQHLYFCAAGLIAAMLTACCPPTITMPVGVEAVRQDGIAELQHLQGLLEQHDFENALQKAEQVLALFPQAPPGDAALFSMGLVQAHYANPQRDTAKALVSFTQLVKDFPESPRTEEARIWAGVLTAVEEKAEQERRSRKQNVQLQRVQRMIGQGDFEGALRENQKVLSLSPKSPPGDAALFNMGLIHIHYANPKRDMGKALSFFAQLAKEFPDSPRTEEAKVWAGILETMEKAKQIDIEIEQKKKGLRR